MIHLLASCFWFSPSVALLCFVFFRLRRELDPKAFAQAIFPMEVDGTSGRLFVAVQDHDVTDEENLNNVHDIMGGLHFSMCDSLILVSVFECF